jgi:magnesium-protoporphyrin O-methyltransferase
MVCPQCLGIEQEFNAEVAQRELRSYRRRGAPRATKVLIDELVRQSVEGSSLVDIGGGVGAIQHALLEAGAAKALAVDASSAYLDAAAAEAERRDLAGRITQQHGDFVSLSDRIPVADIVTLDRVVCCYPDGRSLVAASAGRARRLYGIVFPRRSWWMKVGFFFGNLLLRARGSPFRIFLHPPDVVEDVLDRMGFRRTFYRRTWVWQVAVYAPAPV